MPDEAKILNPNDTIELFEKLVTITHENPEDAESKIKKDQLKLQLVTSLTKLKLMVHEFEIPKMHY